MMTAMWRGNFSGGMSARSGMGPALSEKASRDQHDDTVFA
jgi:hypothetical protein